METKDYTIDELIKIFEKHSKKFWKEEAERKEQLKDDYVDYAEGFCICDAMLSMCKKIKEHEYHSKY